MILLGLDPGPDHSGLVVYDCNNAPYVVTAQARVRWPDMRTLIRSIEPDIVVCERTTAGPPSISVVRTTEVVGRVMEFCESINQRFELLPRRDVLSALGVSARGAKDAIVRQALIELHGGSQAAALGDKRAPGPLYGVTSHAWSALALCVTFNLNRGVKYYVPH